MLYLLRHLLICILATFNQLHLWRVIPGSVDGAGLAILLHGLIVVVWLAVPCLAVRQSLRKLCQSLRPLLRSLHSTDITLIVLLELLIALALLRHLDGAAFV